MDQLLGDIVYFPSDTPELGLGFLYTARQTENTPFFAIAGSSAELYPPSRWAMPSTSSRLWSERQLQRRWLLNTHPEAFMGNTYVQEFLKHDMEHLSNGAECDYGHALLCVGQMADLRLASNIKSMPFLAVATGDSGQQLRLARMDDLQWQWEDNDAVLHIPVPDPLAREDEALWTTDAVPITQIKAVMYVSPSSSFRWLLVQKATSTTILQPEYGSVLLPQPASLSDASLTFQPSFLNPNPLLTLRYDETGGNAHADACFNPPLHGQPPRLALLDVCGYWTVWNISRTRNVKKPALRLSMYKCGHMCADLLGAIPSTPAYPADNHGMIHVGRSKDDEHRQPPRRREENCPGTTVPSPYILLWNSHRCQAMDVESNGWLPMPDLFNGKEPSHGRILDVQRSCVNENHVFVLTTQKLIWLDLFDRDVSLRHQRKPVTLLSCSHVGTGNEDTKMCVGGSSADDANTSLVVTFSSKWEQLCVYWFRLVPPVGLPQWHRQITDLPGISEIPEGTAVRQLWIQPVKLTGVPQCSVTGMGSIYLKNGLKLYQVIILGNDLNVRYCICTVSEDYGLKVTLPTARIRWSDQRRRREWKNKRKRFLRQVSEAFVVPDAMDDDAMMSVLQWKDNNDESGLVTRTDNTQADRACADQPARKPRPVPLNMGQISQALAEQFDLGVRWGAPGLPTGLTDSVYQILQRGQKAGSMPLTTWANIAEGLEDQAPNQTTDDELEDWAERLMSLNDGKTVVTRLKRQDGSGLSGSPLRLSDIKRHLSEFWLEPTKSRFSEEVQKIRKGWVSEIARDVMLSSHGVMVQDVPFIRPRGFEADQQRVHANQSPSLDHRIHNSSPPCSQTTKGTSSTDDAFQRLRLLAPSLEAGRLGKLKPPKVLSYWPTERGAEPASYVSSVAEARDEMFRDAKERLEEKLAKHKALVDRRLKRPAFMGQGSLMSEGPSQKVAMVPTMGIQSSPQAPPASLLSHDLTQTQGPGVTMSQPVEGAFGDLKNAKKKRKTGFR